MKCENWTNLEMWNLLSDPELAAFKEAPKVYKSGVRSGYFWMFKLWHLWLMAIVCVGTSYLIWHEKGAAISAAWFLYRLSLRAGHLEGFQQGFEHGATFGVRRAFEMSDQDVEALKWLCGVK